MARKHIEIDSHDEKDINDMFDAICEDIIGKSPIEIKREVLDFSGSDKEVKKEKVTLFELFDILKLYEITYEFRLKASFMDIDTPTPEKVFVMPQVMSGQNFCEIHKNMEAQRNDITNPELQDVKANVTAPVFNQDKPPVNPDKIEDFNL